MARSGEVVREVPTEVVIDKEVPVEESVVVEQRAGGYILASRAIPEEVVVERRGEVVREVPTEVVIDKEVPGEKIVVVEKEVADVGKIAFVSDRDGDFEIYVMNADGSGQTRLTDNAAGDYWPTWLPEGAPPPPATTATPSTRSQLR